ncbi:MAG: YdeI/OmpD-associated family protein [Pseudomonadota bacterium]
MITAIEDYFARGCGRCDRFATDACSARRWAAGLSRLRTLCREAGLSEHVKWGHPCYMAPTPSGRRNIAILGAFRDSYRLSFFNASLMTDPDRVLEHQGPNTAHPDMIRFTSYDMADALAETVTRYLHEAMSYAAEGRLPPKTTTTVDLPDELIDALDADPALSDAFAALTPGRQRGYALHIGGAKHASTREGRIEKLRPRIFAGKGYNER